MKDKKYSTLPPFEKIKDQDIFEYAHKYLNIFTKYLQQGGRDRGGEDFKDDEQLD